MALHLDMRTLGPVATNCHLVKADADATEAVVIDPAAEPAEIEAMLAAAGATCAAILVTHGHYDHFGALTALAARTGAPVWLPEGELELFRRPEDFFPGIPIEPYGGEATLVSGGETVEAAGITFGVRIVPGHSPAHVSYHADGQLFSGDVLFYGSVGRVDLPGGDWDTLLASIRDLTDAYPPDTVVHPGHGPRTTLGDELARNPFLAELRTP